MKEILTGNFADFSGKTAFLGLKFILYYKLVDLIELCIFHNDNSTTTVCYDGPKGPFKFKKAISLNIQT
ncbi:hypothetical protein CCP2SC5_1220005 [Azospirillaceae bacterium]